jgi:hypothetical protein
MACRVGDGLPIGRWPAEWDMPCRVGDALPTGVSIVKKREGEES